MDVPPRSHVFFLIIYESYWPCPSIQINPFNRFLYNSNVPIIIPQRHRCSTRIKHSTYVGPSCRWLDWGSWGTGRGVFQSCWAVFWCSSPAKTPGYKRMSSACRTAMASLVQNVNSYHFNAPHQRNHKSMVMINPTHVQNFSKLVVKCALYISHLLCVDGIVGELRQMDKFEVKGPELSQDAAPGWGPAPAPTGATATETTSKQED